MTNKERYQQAFSPLHSSTDTMEVWNMKQNNRKRLFPKLMLIAALIALMAVCTAFALRGYLTLNINGEKHLLHEVASSNGQSAYIEEGQDGPTVFFAVGKDGSESDIGELEKELEKMLEEEKQSFSANH